MKTPRSVPEKTQYHAVFCQSTIYWFSFTQNRKNFEKVGIEVYHSNEDKLFRSLRTHKD